MTDSQAWSHPAFEKVAAYLNYHTRLVFSPARRQEAEAGIRRAMERNLVTEIEGYQRLLESGELPLDDLIGELTVGETYFFREPNQFQFLRSRIIPELRKSRGSCHEWSVWSAGCSSGEEAYSLATVLEEEGLAGSVLGTDISREALRKAERGAYGSWSLRGVEPQVLEKWFHCSGSLWSPRVRRARFAWHSLASGVPPWNRKVDLIFCRNVLYYLDRSCLDQLARLFYQTLAEGGWLVTGSADPPLGERAPFTTVLSEWGVFYCKSPQHRSQPAPSLPSAPPAPRKRPRPAAPPPASAQEEAVRQFRSLLQQRAPAELLAEARRQCQRYPLAGELHFLRAMLGLDQGEVEEALEALKRVLYLDPSAVVAHFLLANLLEGQGRLAEAARAFRNARDCARVLPAEEPLRWGEGGSAGAMVQACQRKLSSL